jgi:hypothetical protein
MPVTVTAVNGSRNFRLHNARRTGNAMKRLFVTAVLLFGFVLNANADIWRWTDVHGKVHFVDTLKPIYTWLDESGRLWYSDKPDHEDAVSVELVWHSTGNNIDEAESSLAPEKKPHDTWAYVGETPEDRLEREKAEKYYCKRAQEVYDSYLQAPRLYKTNDTGVREYLSDEESAQTLAETKARVEELCNI